MKANLVITLLIASMLAVACAKEVPIPTQHPVVTTVTATHTSTPEASKYGGVLVVAFPASPQELDPGLMRQSEVYAITAEVYDNLTRIDEKLQPQPQLAEKWQASTDGLTWTFQLRQGVTFHHGTPFTAEDVVRTFGRLLDPEYGSAARSLLSFIDEVAAIGNNTVEFRLNSPNSDLPLILGGVQMRIVARDRTNEDNSTSPSGTGPFKWSTYVPGERVVLTRNPNYWASDEDGNQLPFLDEINFVAISEESSRVAALAAGDINVLWQIAPSSMAVLENSNNAKVLEAPSGVYLDIAINVTEPPFDDVRIRQAMKLVVNRQQMLDIVGLGLGQIGNDQPVAPIHTFWADMPAPERDIEKAKTLLTEAGYPNGIDVTLWTSTVRPGMNDMALLYQQQAAEAGIRVTVMAVPPDGYWDLIFMKKPMFMSKWTFRPTTGETISIAHSSQTAFNETAYTNPKIDDLLTQARAEQNPEQRLLMYSEIQRIIAEEGGTILPFYQPNIMAVSADVNGFLPHPTTWLDFRTTWIGR